MIGKLSNRLQQVADLVTPGMTVADIGTDHGYVPIYLVSNGICPKAYAMDVNEGPLMRAKEHIAENGLENKIETRLSDGLQALKPGEAGAVVIAGMGGMLMKRILQDNIGTVYAARELILSPQSDLTEFRAFLKAQTLGVVDERIIYEDGKYYWIFKVIPHRGTITRNVPQEVRERFGEILFERKEPLLRQYLEQQADKLTEILETMRDKVADPERMQSIAADLDAVQKGLAIFEG